MIIKEAETHCVIISLNLDFAERGSRVSHGTNWEARWKGWSDVKRFWGEEFGRRWCY